MQEQWLTVLQNCVLFEGISSQELKTMLTCLVRDVAHYTKDDIICLAGDPFDGLGVVVEGEVMITRENLAGDRLVMNQLGPGEIFGELAAFGPQETWPATVTAQGDVTVLFIPPEKIVGSCERACPSHRMLVTNMLKLVSKRALGLRRQVEYLSMKTLRGKISAYLLYQYQQTGRKVFILPLKRDELADYLNVARPSLSRGLARMRDEGLIDFHRSSVQIKDLEALRKGIQ